MKVNKDKERSRHFRRDPEITNNMKNTQRRFNSKEDHRKRKVNKDKRWIFFFFASLQT